MNRSLKRYLVWPLVVLIFLLVIIRLAIPPVAVSAINNWFEQQGITSEIADISLDLREANLSLSGLQARRDGQPALNLEHLIIVWSWSALLDRHFILKSLAVSSLDFDIEQGPEQHLVIAGIDIGRAAAQDEVAAETSDDQPSAWKISLRRLDIDNLRLCYRALPQHDYCNGFERLTWDGQLSIDLSRTGTDETPLSTRGNLELDNLKIHDNKLDRALLGFDQLGIVGIEMDSPKDIAVDSIELDALVMLERDVEAEQAQITSLDKLQIDRARLQDFSKLELGEVKLLDHELFLLNQPDQTLEIEAWLKTGEPKQTAAPAATKSGPSFDFKIDKLTYQTKKSLHYRDLSLEQAFDADLNSIELVLQDLDSRQPRQPSRIKYSARYAEHGSIELSGLMRPLAERKSFDLTGSIEGLDLRDLSAFTAGTIGHSIKSGQLDADLKLRAEENQLDSSVDLKLHHFNLQALSDADREKIDASFGFPLNTGLSLLKDRDNRIELTIPITGDLQNPDFDPGDAVTQAMSSAITTAVLNYYTPFGLIAAVDGLFSLATALNFDPVVFENGSGDVTPAEQTGLEKIVSLMQERPGIHVTLCAFTNTADRVFLLPDSAEIDPAELELDADQLAQLASLGEKRALAVKDFLARSIDPARLVICASEHSEGDGLAGVEISI